MNERSPPPSALTPELEIGQLLRGIWKGRWIIAGITAGALLLGILYVLTATRIYRAEVVMSPVGQRHDAVNLGQLGGLAALAGLGVSSTSNSEPLAVLKSKAFVADFITETGALSTVLGVMSRPSIISRVLGGGGDEPDLQDAAEYFSREALLVSEDKKTGLVTVTVEWPDARLAAQWANSLVVRLNAKMRQTSLAESEGNIHFLQGELQKNSVVPLQQAIGRILESEMQKLMLARGSVEFVFRVIDQAVVARKPSRPMRKLIIGLFAAAGVMLSITILAVRGFLAVDGQSARSSSH